MSDVTVATNKRVAGKVNRKLDETYRKYRLIAGQKGERFAAVAYAGRKPACSTVADDLDEALDTLKQSIDRDYQKRAERLAESDPTQEDFELALDLASARYSAVQRHVVERIGIDGERPVSLQQLQRNSELTDEAVLRALARTAKMVAEVVQVSTPGGPASAEAAFDVIAVEFDTSEHAGGRWLFKPEFVIAAARHTAS